MLQFSQPPAQLPPPGCQIVDGGRVAAESGGHIHRWLVGALWSAVVIGGFAYGVVYERTSAPGHSVAGSWPVKTGCIQAEGRPTLVMFIHPKCPCTRASLAELSNLQRHCGDRLEIECVFLQPRDATWICEETEHWQSVQGLKVARMLKDPNGVEHRRFGATTSGEVFLFDASGALAFHGGITEGRGHFGESAGRQAVESLVLHSTELLPQTAVYGCPLEPHRQAACEGDSCEMKLPR